MKFIIHHQIEFLAMKVEAVGGITVSHSNEGVLGHSQTESQTLKMSKSVYKCQNDSAVWDKV